MPDFLNMFLLFVTIVSTIKIVFLDYQNHKRIENKNTIKNNTTPLYNKEYKEELYHIYANNNDCELNTSYFIHYIR
jgi:cell division protein FtsL